MFSVELIVQMITTKFYRHIITTCSLTAEHDSGWVGFEFVCVLACVHACDVNISGENICT